MFEKLIFLVILGLAHSAPEGLSKGDHLEPHGDCPPIHEHWLLPHEYDCTLFYYCEYGLKWIQPRRCARGTEFSYELQVCVHPELAQCSLPGGPKPTTEEAPVNSGENGGDDNGNSGEGNGGNNSGENNGNGNNSGEGNGDGNNSVEDIELLPNGCPADFDNELLLPSEDCSKFYKCTYGEKVELSCPAYLHFNPATQKCDYRENAGCQSGGNGDNGGNGSGEDNGNGNNSGEGNGSGNNSGEDNGNGNNSEEDNGDGNNSVEDIELLPNGCPADFDNELLLPSEDCSKFYKCTYGEKVELSCPAYLHFNPATQKCDYRENAGCQSGGNGDNGGNGSGEDNGNGNNSGEGNGSGNNSGEDNGNGNNSEEDNGDGNNSVEDIELLPNGCPADFDNELLLPSEDCSKFYKCTYGEKVELSCPAYLHFNPATQKCDYRENAGCQSGGNGDNGGNGSGEDNGNGNNSGEDNSNGNNSGEGNGDVNNSVEDIELLPNGCPADFDNELLLPSEDCSKFYKCTYGEKVELSCPAYLHFNPATQKCDYRENAGCQSGGNGDNGGNGSGEDNGNGNNSGEDNSNGNNSGEGNGNGNNSGEGNGDGNNSVEDIELLPNGCPADFDNELLLPSEDCSKFYKCTYGEKVELSCPAYLHFNPATQKCDYRENAGCQSGGNGDNGGNGSGEDNGNGNNSGEDNGSGNNSGEDNGNGNNSGEGNGDGNNSVEDIELLPNGCPADFDNELLLPSEDCSKFYKCTYGEKVELSCPAYLHFNPATQKCDYRENAGCQAGGNGDNGGNGSGEDNGNGNNSGEDNGNGNNSGEGNGDGNNSVEDIELLPNGCPADFDNELLLPSEDCSKFYKCTYGEKVELSCPAYLHFNPTTQKCDYRENAGCQSGGNGDNGGNGSGEDNGNGNNSGENGGNSNRCADGCNILPWSHDIDCNKFWQCNGEAAVLVTCSDGLYFNIASKTCDFASNVYCARK